MMKEDPRSIGRFSEDIAAGFLQKQGYRILERNISSRLGELDIVARDKDTLCFIEVKFRSNLTRGLPEEAITNSKRHKICKSALVFLKKNNFLEEKARFDVVSINSGSGEIKLFKNAFDLETRYSY